MRLITFMLLAALSFSVSAAGKFGFINTQKLLEQSPQAIAAMTELQQQFGEREQKLRDLAKSIQDMEQTFRTDSAIMSTEQKQKAEENIIQSKRRFQFEQESLKEDLQVKQRELRQQIQLEVREVILAYGLSQGYDFIFTDSSVAFASDAVDITDEILEELKK